nr:MAG TPA: hypothetical protein [Caudoviricetes sp.]
MPDDYYVSQYSGEEIDDLLGKAGSATGAVRYDAAQSLTDAQTKQARANIGAASSGGGVMETAQEVAASSASESYDTFCAKLDEVLATMPSKSVKFLRVYPPQYYGAGSDMCALFKNTDDYASVYTISSYNEDRQGFRMIKYKRRGSDPAGQWDPLEYINPPMQLGVEYRTTERYRGKPVYIRLEEIAALPNNTTLTVSKVGVPSGGTLYVDNIVDYRAEFYSNSTVYSIPYNDVVDIPECSGIRYGSGITYSIRTKGVDYSNYAGRIWIKYTKQTD